MVCMLSKICNSLYEFVCLPCNIAEKQKKLGKKATCILYVPVIGHAAYLLGRIARCFLQCCCKPERKKYVYSDPIYPDEEGPRKIKRGKREAQAPPREVME